MSLASKFVWSSVVHCIAMHYLLGRAANNASRDHFALLSWQNAPLVKCKYNILLCLILINVVNPLQLGGAKWCIPPRRTAI